MISCPSIRVSDENSRNGCGWSAGTGDSSLLGSGVNEIVAIDRDDLDFSIPEQVAEGVALHRADWVINCAAYTQVDKAEQEQEAAFKVNRDSALGVAEGVKSYGGRLLQVSTDFIFDGSQSTPFRDG